MNQELIKEIIDSIKSGSLLLLPSGGIPGLSASASSKAAITSLNEIKQRSDTRGLVTLVGNFEQASSHWDSLPENWQKALKSEWPAHLTVVYGQNKSSNLKTGFQGSIGLRVPALSEQDMWMYEVLNVQPIASTSVNQSGYPAAINWDDARRFCRDHSIVVPNLPNQGDTNLDPSTVLEIYDDGSYKVHRKGACSQEKIEKLLKKAL